MYMYILVNFTLNVSWLLIYPFNRDTANVDNTPPQTKKQRRKHARNHNNTHAQRNKTRPNHIHTLNKYVQPTRHRDTKRRRRLAARAGPMTRPRHPRQNAPTPLPPEARRHVCAPAKCTPGACQVLAKRSPVVVRTLVQARADLLSLEKKKENNSHSLLTSGPRGWRCVFVLPYDT